MKNFLKTVLATVVGNLLVLAISGFLLCSFIALVLIGLSAGGGEKTLTVPDKAILVLDLSMSINDAPAGENGAFSDFTGGGAPRVGLWDLTRALDAAAGDKRIAGVLVTGSLAAGESGNGLAALAELRRSLLAFRKRAPAKLVLAYLEAPTLKDYYVATAAGEIWLNPYSESAPLGLVSQNIYIGNALAKYGVGAQVVKCGRYKSAVEALTSDRMSEEDREQRTALLDAQWETFATDATAGRRLAADAAAGTGSAGASLRAAKITPARLREIAAEFPVLDAKTAVALGLADRTAYLDEVIAELRMRGATADTSSSTTGGAKGFGAVATGGGSGTAGARATFAQVNARDYARDIAAKARKREGAHVAIVYAEGEIVDDDGGDTEGTVSGRALSARLRAIAEDADARAVVLRVNSPGGSAYASEVIQREVRRLAANGKPVVVSFGSVAASGGYWIAACGRKIFAERATVTGSIGVFGIVPNIQQLAASWGVTFDSVKTSPHADIETLTRPKTPEEMAALQKLTDRIYDAFLDKVAEGRKLERGRVAELAGGRVWSGADARKHGLVDEIGGLREAVEFAANEAGLGADHAVRQYPEPRTPLEQILEILSDDGTAPPVAKVRTAAANAFAPRANPRSAAGKMLRPARRLLRQLSLLDDPAGVYARLPWWEAE
ncbi:MAG: signal peptide peptidase SppA [Puniceicoccales bacterium]|jgi:protease-4|nr:signal peptide peptidase SppA [Puniceicoccales bacterium]